MHVFMDHHCQKEKKKKKTRGVLLTVSQDPSRVQYKMKSNTKNRMETLLDGDN